MLILDMFSGGLASAILGAAPLTLSGNVQTEWVFPYYYGATVKRRARIFTWSDLVGDIINGMDFNYVNNVSTVIDERGNSGRYAGDFTLLYHYDDLKRLIGAEIPASSGQADKPLIALYTIIA